MNGNQTYQVPDARVTAILMQALRARRLAREFARDPVAVQLAHYAAELMDQAECLKAEAFSSVGSAPRRGCSGRDERERATSRLGGQSRMQSVFRRII
jgi:hypothetical protein